MPVPIPSQPLALPGFVSVNTWPDGDTWNATVITDDRGPAFDTALLAAANITARVGLDIKPDTLEVREADLKDDGAVYTLRYYTTTIPKENTPS